MPLKKGSDKLDVLFERVKSILSEARARAWKAVNSAMVVSYWEIGHIIIDEEQKGKSRAEYGKKIISGLAQRLSAEFGKGFDERNLWFIRSFYVAYPKMNALRSELSWTHYRLLLRVENPEARAFYEIEAVNAHWSTRCRKATSAYPPHGINSTCLLKTS